MGKGINRVGRYAASVAGMGLIAGLLAPALASADDAPPPPPPPVDLKIQAGYVAAHGNTDSKTGNAKLELTLNQDQWKHYLDLEGLYGQQNGISTAGRITAMWQSNYKFSDNLYAFGGLRYDDDRFSGFAYQESLTAGVGYTIFAAKSYGLDAQLGAGYRRILPELLIKDAAGNVTDRVELSTETGAIGTAQLKGFYAFNDSTKVLDTLYAESGSDNTLLQNDLGLQVAMSKSLSLVAGYQIKHNSSPPAGLVKTDSLITFNVAYEYK